MQPVHAQSSTGTLVPVGGGYADVYPGIVTAFLEQAQGNVVNLTVLPTTYATNAEAITAAELEVNLRDAERRRFELEEACKRAAPAGVACTAKIAPIFTRADAENPDNLDYFGDDVTGIFVLGGDQGVAMQALANTPVEEAIAAFFARGGVIAGTSAGGAVQSRAMIADYSRNFAAGNALDDGAAELWQDENRRGLIVGVEGAVLDQHFFQRGRMGRLLGAILRDDAPHIGIGVDAYTGLRIESGHVLTGVFGLYTVAVLDAATYGAVDSVRLVGDRRIISARNVLVHLLAPGGFAYDLSTRTHTLAAPPRTITRRTNSLDLPERAGPLLLTGALKNDSLVWTHFAELTEGSDDPLLIVATGFANQRPAQRAAQRLGEQLGGDFKTVVVGEDDPLVIEGAHRGIIVLARDQSLLAPGQLGALKDAWLDGVPLLLDGAAVALAGVAFSAHPPTPEDAEAAEIATQRSFLTGRTVITDGLALLNITVEPQILADNRWGRLFSLAYERPGTVALGISDGAGLLVTREGASVVGDNVVISLDLRRASLDLGANQAFVIANGLIDVFAPDDGLRFDRAMQTRQRQP